MVLRGTCLILFIVAFARTTIVTARVRMRTFVRGILRPRLRFAFSASYTLYNFLDVSLILFTNTEAYAACAFLEFSEIAMSYIVTFSISLHFAECISRDNKVSQVRSSRSLRKKPFRTKY